jgi:copper chaperone CopZ
MTKTKLKVSGMHCASCALSIDDRLEELDGVRAASTSFRRGQTKLQFDEEKVDLDAVRAAIAELGYEAETD